MPKSKSYLMTYAEAINQAMILEAKKDKSLIFFQGLTDPTSVFGTLTNINKFVDQDRLIEMPVSENGAVGVAIGSIKYLV